MGTLQGVQPELANRFLAIQRAAAQAGFQIGITSGYRDIAQQIALRKKNGCPNVWTASARSCRVPTAIPGRSNHNSGLAIDFSGTPAAKQWVAAHAGTFGLSLPVEGEDWHLELAGGKRADNIRAGLGGGFDLDFQMTPEQAVDERIQSVRDLITGTMMDDLGGQYLASPGSPDLAAASPTLEEPDLGIDTTTIQPGAEGLAGSGKWSGDVPPPGYVPPGKGVERWSDVARAALRYTGQPEEFLPLLLRRMSQESGGNPTIANNWDINAQRGDPSIGLMQNIGSAFPDRARELTGRGIRDGFANIVASIRYTLGRYGTLQAWGRKGGY